MHCTSVGDVFIAAFFGILGYLMVRADYPRITLVIAFVLSGLMERNFIQSIIMFEANWLRFLARLGAAQSAGVAFAALAFVYVIFVFVLEYRLFGGIIAAG